ncbi:phosphate acetyltransferase [Algirhabdus cladophorae]|uniref:phosphate acetyltransferase n=1 Tax=Algirhabdus cladophorae TaxID=3377108 RepID=UPI003B846B80
MLPPLASLMDRAAATPKTVALSEGSDPRVVSAALEARKMGLAQIILVGDTSAVEAEIATQGGDLCGITIHDPDNTDLHETCAATYAELRAKKGVTLETAAKLVRDPLIFAALLVRLGHADGTVGGAVATTSDTVRAALHVIGKAPDAAIVSSFFLMCLPADHPLGEPAMVFSDCGMVIDPDANELAAITQQAAASFASLMGDTPRVGMLSFSTKGSARHPNVDKVTQALALVQAAAPDLAVDGELQLDAALVPSVAAAKAPDSDVAGEANVLIFPNLDAGNIGYKMAQRFGGATAIGPVLQGLAKPANDLSRGCVAEDVLAMIAVTAVQAST